MQLSARIQIQSSRVWPHTPLPRHLDVHKHTIHPQYRQVLMRHYATNLWPSCLVLGLLAVFGPQLTSGMQVVTVINALDSNLRDDSIAFSAQTSILGLCRRTMLLTVTYKSPIWKTIKSDARHRIEFFVPDRLVDS
jgi:hypothetical protein